jgi:hypothetical protein
MRLERFIVNLIDVLIGQKDATGLLEILPAP